MMDVVCLRVSEYRKNFWRGKLSGVITPGVDWRELKTETPSRQPHNRNWEITSGRPRKHCGSGWRLPGNIRRGLLRLHPGCAVCSTPPENPDMFALHVVRKRPRSITRPVGRAKNWRRVSFGMTKIFSWLACDLSLEYRLQL